MNAACTSCSVADGLMSCAWAVVESSTSITIRVVIFFSATVGISASASASVIFPLRSAYEPALNFVINSRMRMCAMFFDLFRT